MKCRERDPDALRLLGDCYLKEENPKQVKFYILVLVQYIRICLPYRFSKLHKALSYYQRSLDARPKQAEVALKVSELLIRRPETKNLSSAQIWLSKAEAMNKGKSEFFALKLDYMKCKGIKSEDIVKFISNQIRNNPKNVKLYTTLIQEVSSTIYE